MGLLRTGQRPVVIAHRGASGHRPEHTLGAYELAARMGADYLEPDLVVTADGALIARHENEIGETTDVAAHPDLADRHTVRVVDGQSRTGWFADDLTLAEVRRLRARERLPQLRIGNTRHDGTEPVPTLGEIIELRARLGDELGRSVGLYIETKHPSHHEARGLDITALLAAQLRAAGLDRPDSPVVVQSFELANLVRLRAELGCPVPLVLLVADGEPYEVPSAGGTISSADLVTRDGLAHLADLVDGIGPAKELVIPRTSLGRLAGPTSLVRDAHRVGLVVHPWTFRAENAFLPLEHRSGRDPAAIGDAAGELAAYLRAGVDGVFTDHPALGVVARDRLSDRRRGR